MGRKRKSDKKGKKETENHGIDKEIHAVAHPSTHARDQREKSRMNSARVILMAATIEVPKMGATKKD